jgi:hypothetical protein
LTSKRETATEGDRTMKTNRQLVIDSLENKLWLVRHNDNLSHDDIDDWTSITVNELVEEICHKLDIMDWYKGMSDNKYKLMVMVAIKKSKQ